MTINIQPLDNTQEDMEIEDILSCLSADLVELKSNNPFLERLFAIEAGKWVVIDSLCYGLKPIESQLELLKKSCEGTLRVTWLDYPDAALGQGYCLIIFYLESLHWNNLALYNKKNF